MRCLVFETLEILSFSDGYLSLLTKVICHLIYAQGRNVTKNLKNTMAMRYLSTQIDQLAEFGYSQERSLSFLNLTISILNDADLRVNIIDVERLYKDASKFLNDPCLGLRVGHGFRISSYMRTGSIYAFCKDLKQVIELNSRYQCLAIDAGVIAYECKDMDGTQEHFLNLHPYEDIMDCHHVLSMIAGAYATTFKWLSWGSGNDLKSISFSQIKPADMTFLSQTYDCPIHFGQKRIGIEFFEDAINASLTMYDSEKLALAVARLESLLESNNTNESFDIAVRASIRGALELGQVSLPIIASRLSLPERDFRRRLKKADIKYRDLLEDERQKKFKALYDEGRTFSIISQELCYNDQAAFNRAFRRWYGQTPSQYVRGVKAR